MTPHEIEVSAGHGAEMPDGLNSPEQCLFLTFRNLYRGFRAGDIPHEQAAREKQRILKAFDDFKGMRDFYYILTERWSRAEQLMPEVEKNIADCPTCATAKRIIKILDGRERGGSEPPRKEE